MLSGRESAHRIGYFIERVKESYPYSKSYLCVFHCIYRTKWVFTRVAMTAFLTNCFPAFPLHTLPLWASHLTSESSRPANPEFLRLGRAHINCRPIPDLGINESIADPVTVTATATDFANASIVVCNMNHISTVLFKNGQRFEIGSCVLRLSWF